MDKEVKEEKVYFLSVVSTFKSYRHQSLLRIENKEKCLNTLPTYHKKWLGKYKKDLQSFKECIETNSKLIPIVLQYVHTIFDNVYSIDSTQNDIEVTTLEEGLDKVQSVFKQLMRDWSSMGAEERKQCYQPIIDEICWQYPDEKYRKSDLNILVPGAGLGRLAFEIAHLGFACQGNEFNLFMLIVSYYVLNHCKTVNEYLIYPWIHQYCNNLNAEHQMTSVRFPDVIPSMPTEESRFSMTAGDFLEVYTDNDIWDCVATCFFIDCAPNVVQFIETIYNILKPGGLWINLGPLLYHYSDVKNEKSVEPSFEVLCEVVKSIGFIMEKCKTGIKTKYCQNPKSMLQYEYDSVFFVCRKPENIIDGDDVDGEGSIETIG